MKAAKYVRREQSFAEFLRENEKSFERMAAYILGRWKAPNDVSVADVAQELRIAAWRYARRYDAKYGKTPEQYVGWNAINVAKKYVHRQRRARGDRGIGHFELLGLTASAIQEECGSMKPTQEEELERRELVRRLVERCASTREAVCLVVFLEAASAKVAAKRIVENQELRELCKVDNVKDAARMVRKAVKEQACQRG